MFNFTILKKSKKSRARLGIISTPHGDIETPSFVPVATRGSVRTLDSDTQEASCREAQPGDLDAWMARVLSPVTSPLSGLFSAREASMVFRNDQEFDTLRQRFSGLMAADGAPFLFERVSFENAARASFSWYLPKRDLNCMRLQLAEPHNQKAFDRLEALWNK